MHAATRPYGTTGSIPGPASAETQIHVPAMVANVIEFGHGEAGVDL